MTERRLRRIEVSPELLAELILSGYRFNTDDGKEMVVKVSGIPSDARGVRLGLTSEGNLSLVLEHDSFPQVHEGDVIVRDTLWFTQHTSDALEKSGGTDGKADQLC